MKYLSSVIINAPVCIAIFGFFLLKSTLAGTTYYVAAEGSDSNNGTSEATPLRTIQKAFNTVSAGDTVLIHGGTYRPSGELFLKTDGTAENPIIIDTYNTSTEPVVIKGSDLMDSGWSRVPDNPNSQTSTYTKNIWKRKIDDFPSSYPRYTQQAFIHFTSNFASDEDGHPLSQVGPINPTFISTQDPNSIRPISKTIFDDTAPGNTASGIPYAGSFYYYWGQDYNEDSPNTVTNPQGFDKGYLYIRLHDFQPTDFDPSAFDPNIDYSPGASDTGSIEVSVRNWVILPKASHQAGEPHREYYEFHNLQFKHNNSSRSLIKLGSGGHLVVTGPNSLVKNCVFAWGDHTGMALGFNSIAENCVFRDNGALGAEGADGSIFRRCTIEKNNERKFDYDNHTGGIKNTTDRWGTVTECVVQDNYGPGIWFDGINTESTSVISNNLIIDNIDGIIFEISQNATISNNIVTGNKRRGVYLSQSRNAVVMHNTITGTELHLAVDLNGFPLDGQPRKDKNGNIYYLEDNLVYNNLISNNDGTGDLDLASNPWTRNNTIDNNCYYRGDGSVKMYTAGMQYTSLSSWQAATGHDSHSISQDPDLDPTGYMPSASSPLIDAGAWVRDFTDIDYFGIARPHFSAFDIGAVEYTAGLVLHLPFDEGVGDVAFDYSLEGNDSSNDGSHGFPTWGQGKMGNGALQFDGIDDYVEIADSDSLTPARNFTFMAWMKPESITWGGGGMGKQRSYGILMRKTRGYAVTCGFHITNDSGTRFVIHPRPARKYWGQSPVTFPMKQWHHVAGVYNGAEIVLYVNGVEIGRTPATGDLQKNAFPLLIGEVAAARFFRGAIDDVRIYESALSSAQIHQICDHGRLALHLPFDEGSGSIAYDFSLEENDSINDGANNFPDWSDGKVGSSALDFDGITDYVKIADSDSLTPAQKFTVMAWMKPGLLSDDAVGISKPSSFQMLMRKDGDSAVTCEFSISNDRGRTFSVHPTPKRKQHRRGIFNDRWRAFLVYLAQKRTKYRWGTHDRPVTTFPVDQWHHVVGVYNGKKISLYVDGVKIGATAARGPLKNSSSPLFIGMGGTSKFYKGAIDDVRIYNVALTASEITAMYQDDDIATQSSE